MKYPRGVEHYDRSPGNNAIQGQGGAECGALGAQSALMGPDLRAVIDAWPRLSADARHRVLSLVTGADSSAVD